MRLHRNPPPSIPCIGRTAPAASDGTWWRRSFKKPPTRGLPSARRYYHDYLHSWHPRQPEARRTVSTLPRSKTTCTVPQASTVPRLTKYFSEQGLEPRGDPRNLRVQFCLLAWWGLTMAAKSKAKPHPHKTAARQPATNPPPSQSAKPHDSSPARLGTACIFSEFRRWLGLDPTRQ